MSILTLSQIKAEITTILGERADAASRMNNVINMAQIRLARLHDFDELRARTTISTVVTADPAVDKIISLSTLGRFRKIYSIRLFATGQRSRKLEKVLSKRWDEIIPEPEYYARGVPTHYIMWGKDEMELWRVPDIVYVMHFRYSRWPNVATDADNGNTIDLENVDDLIIHLSASYLALSFGNVEKSNDLYSIYRALAREAIGEDDEDFDLHMSAVRPTIGTSRGYDDPFVRSMDIVGR